MPFRKSCRGCHCRLHGTWLVEEDGEFCGALCRDLYRAGTDETKLRPLWEAYDAEHGTKWAQVAELSGAVNALVAAQVDRVHQPLCPCERCLGRR